VTLYSIYERHDQPPAAIADGFSWFAGLLPPVYALVHGLWLMLLGWVVLVAAVVTLGWFGGGAAAFWTYILVAILLGFEAATFRRLKLGRAGWQHHRDIIAMDQDLAIVEALQRK
jgi:hypothetical protein